MKYLVEKGLVSKAELPDSLEDGKGNNAETRQEANDCVAAGYSHPPHLSTPQPQAVVSSPSPYFNSQPIPRPTLHPPLPLALPSRFSSPPGPSANQHPQGKQMLVCVLRVDYFFYFNIKYQRRVVFWPPGG